MTLTENICSIPLGYFNAGVLLIDLDKVRAERLFSKAKDFLEREDPPLADQDALNWALWGRWHPLDIAWNLQHPVVKRVVEPGAPPEVWESVCGTRIVHYTTHQKPWLPYTPTTLGPGSIGKASHVPHSPARLRACTASHGPGDCGCGCAGCADGQDTFASRESGQDRPLCACCPGASPAGNLAH